MTRAEAIRCLLFSHGRACAALARKSGGTLADALADEHAMIAAIRSGARLSADEVERLLRPLITSDAPTPSPTPGDIETCRMVAAYA